jgi:hypothetical protein
MEKKRKHIAHKDTRENMNKDSIKKLKNKVKHQTDALNKILKTIKNEDKRH